MTPRSLRLLVAATLLSGCTTVHRLEGLDDCPDPEPPSTIKDLRVAYGDIDGVEVVSGLSPEDLSGVWTKMDYTSVTGDNLRFAPEGTATRHFFGDLGPQIRVHLDEGTWAFDPDGGQLVVRLPDGTGPYCASAERYDVVRMDGAVWLVQPQARPVIRARVEAYRENPGAAGYILSEQFYIRRGP